MYIRFVCRLAGLLLAGWLVFSGLTVSAQETNTTWLARSWQSEDGLPDNSVNGLAQTPDGFLWIGTPSGLARFDGLDFETISLTNVIALPNRGIVAMVSGRRGGLWLAMDRGAVVYVSAGASCIFDGNLPGGTPYDLAEDAGGGLLVAYRDGSAWYIDGTNTAPVTSRQNYPEGSDLCSLVTGENGRVWFAKAGQIGFFRGGMFQTVCHLQSGSACLAAAKGGGVWISAGSHLWKCSEGGQLQDFGDFGTANNGTAANGTTTVLFEDHEGAVWIGTSFSGLYRWSTNGFETIPTTHQGILSLIEDHEGNIWVGTFGGGLDRIRRRAISLEGLESGLPFVAVQSICQGADGTLWAVTENGVVVHKINDKWNPMPAGNQWPINANCIAADPQGSIWIGTSQQGLFCWRNGNFVNWGDAAQLQGKTIHTLLVGRNGDIWMGLEVPSAVVRLHDGQLTVIKAPGRVIRAMVEDATGNIWAGTSEGALLRVTGNQIELVTPRPSRELASIRCLYATPDGSLWIGYAGWGVGRLKDGHYTEFNTAQGLYDNYISHIVADGRGWLWFGANRGIFKVRQQDFRDLAGGQASHVRSVHYGRGEGLPSLQATFGDSPDVLRSSDWRLWIPMQTALVVVDPAKLYRKAEPPPTWLMQVTVDDRVVGRYNGILPESNPAAGNRIVDLSRPGKKLRLPPGLGHAEFDFVALSFNAPENVQYRYRLKGSDDDWIEAGTRRTAIYPRLPSGKYTFEVTACDSDGDWNPAAATVELIVSPFFWQTWWFRLAAVAGFTAGIIFVVRYVSFHRLQRQLHMLEQQATLQKERARIAKDIHDDLGASLTQIAFLGDLAQQDRSNPKKVGDRIGIISATARQAIKALDEIVWAVNPRNDTLAHLIDYAGQFAVDYLHLAGVRCRLDFPEQIPPHELSAEIRHNLFLAIKEALHNIVKHAGADEVWLRADLQANLLEMKIEDNGEGFADASDNALADGLRNMRQRMADIGGECRVESRPDTGTRVTFRLPWPENHLNNRSIV